MSPLRIVSQSTRLFLLLSSQGTIYLHNIVILSHLLREITLLDFFIANLPQAKQRSKSWHDYIPSQIRRALT